MGDRTERNCFGELFGPVMGIKAVMNSLAGNPLFVIILPLGRFCARNLLSCLSSACSCFQNREHKPRGN